MALSRSNTARVGTKSWRHLLIGTAFLLFALGISPFASAQSFIEGKHYTVIPTPVLMQMPAGKVEVREFFWYGCPHCYTLEPYISDWEKPKSVEFVTTPAMLGKNWVDHAYTYYALKALGKLDELHPILFDAIHRKKKRLYKIAQIGDFLAGYGLEKKEFEKAVESFSVSTEIKRAERLAKSYGISSVPIVVVNGKYALSPSTVGSYENFFKAVDYLVEKESK